MHRRMGQEIILGGLRGVRGHFPRENFEMYSLVNAISRVLRKKFFFFASENNAFLQVRTNRFHMIRKIIRLLVEIVRLINVSGQTAPMKIWY